MRPDIPFGSLRKHHAPFQHCHSGEASRFGWGSPALGKPDGRDRSDAGGSSAGRIAVRQVHVEQLGRLWA